MTEHAPVKKADAHLGAIYEDGVGRQIRELFIPIKKVREDVVNGTVQKTQFLVINIYCPQLSFVAAGSILGTLFISVS